MPKKLHLICNAHIDPVWLWEWEEGLAETLSTFRLAANFCEEFDSFAFCHNEALLYQWIEIYEPDLFKRIQNLVARDKWHIIGGWYLQPDCNIPSGESFVRQALVGKRYFLEKFNVEPKTALNFDPFGHTRGLVQIMAKAGYNSYLFCRPDANGYPLESYDFWWVGYDGSEILAHRADEHYNSNMGKVDKRILDWLNGHSDKEVGMMLWGIGNHGGGPSRIDLELIEELKQTNTGFDLVHSRPEAYFDAIIEQKNIPRHPKDINPWAVGCYTSMALVKQKHRQLENMYYFTEKALVNLAVQEKLDYPKAQLQEALEDMLFCEFHDILPGSAIQEVEAYAVQRLDHGIEIIRRLRAQAFFKMLDGHAPAAEGEFPLFIYNPHPYDIEEIIVAELQPPEPNFNWNINLRPDIYDCDGKLVPSQTEKASCNIQVDQRKRVVFKARLKASSMNRFSCYLQEEGTPWLATASPDKQAAMTFSNETCEVTINRETGFIDSYRVAGIDYLQANAMQLFVMKDDADPWGMRTLSYRDIEGSFELMTPEESAKFAGVDVHELEPVRIIEDGATRTIVEASFRYNNSAALLRYKLPKIGNEIEIDLRVFYMEKDRMLKLSIPSTFTDGRCRGQVAYGTEDFDKIGVELIAQKWTGITAADSKHALTIINKTSYGFDFKGGEIRLSLLRSPAYAGHPVRSYIPIVHQDRFEQRIDQGVRVFTFWLNAGPAKERDANIDREALIKNESPMVLCAFPAGTGEMASHGVSLSNESVLLTALKMAESDGALILRLFEPLGKPQSTTIDIPALDMSLDISMKAFELKSIAVDLKTKSCKEVDLIERKID